MSPTDVVYVFCRRRAEIARSNKRLLLQCVCVCVCVCVAYRRYICVRQAMSGDSKEEQEAAAAAGRAMVQGFQAC